MATSELAPTGLAALEFYPELAGSVLAAPVVCVSLLVACISSTDMSVLNSLNPEVILLDMGLEDGDNLRFAETVRATFPQARLIVMDLLPTYEDIGEYVQAGAAGFIGKDATLEDLVNTIRSVAKGRDKPLPSRSSTRFSFIARNAVSGRSPASGLNHPG